jgi:hypothetical protein
MKPLMSISWLICSIAFSWTFFCLIAFFTQAVPLKQQQKHEFAHYAIK